MGRRAIRRVRSSWRPPLRAASRAIRLSTNRVHRFEAGFGRRAASARSDVVGCRVDPGAGAGRGRRHDLRGEPAPALAEGRPHRQDAPPPGTRSRCGIPSIPPRSAIRSVFRSSLRPPGRTSRTAGTSRRCGTASPARRAPASPDATAPLLFQALLGVPVSLLLRQHESEPRLEGGSRRIRPDSPGGRLRTSYSGMCRWDRLLAGRAAVRGAPTLGAAGEQGRTGT